MNIFFHFINRNGIANLLLVVLLAFELLPYAISARCQYLLVDSQTTYLPLLVDIGANCEHLLVVLCAKCLLINDCSFLFMLFFVIISCVIIRNLYIRLSLTS